MIHKTNSFFICKFFKKFTSNKMDPPFLENYECMHLFYLSQRKTASDCSVSRSLIACTLSELCLCSSQKNYCKHPEQFWVSNAKLFLLMNFTIKCKWRCCDVKICSKQQAPLYAKWHHCLSILELFLFQNVNL